MLKMKQNTMREDFKLYLDIDSYALSLSEPSYCRVFDVRRLVGPKVDLVMNMSAREEERYSCPCDYDGGHSHPSPCCFETDIGTVTQECEMGLLTVV